MKVRPSVKKMCNDLIKVTAEVEPTKHHELRASEDVVNLVDVEDGVDDGTE